MQKLTPLVFPLIVLLYLLDYTEYILPSFVGVIVLTAFVELWKVLGAWWASHRASAAIRKLQRKREREQRLQQRHEVEMAKHRVKQPPPPSPEERTRARLLVLKTLHEQKVDTILHSGMPPDAIQAAINQENGRYEREISSAISG
jgi:uncharacterized membrane protein YciS (DUF1049 family)